MEREARRKKIASQGNDRLALITGRIQNRDPNISRSDDIEIMITNGVNQIVPLYGTENRVLFFNKKGKSGTDVPDAQISHDNCDEVSKANASGIRVSDLQKPEQSSLVDSRVSNAADKANFPDKPSEYRRGFITPKQVIFSIISSEDTRAICTLVIAILVVLSHVSLPHYVVKSKSLIAYRPLYAVLLTDMLIVAARLVLYAHGQEFDSQPNFEVDGYNWIGAIKMLEWGVVLHHTLRAILIDCSFYLVIVVCGLSLVS
ncbi:UNVERIFIED_CONTAM: hypothetical protein Sangu_2079000 [Sesamum angustifolium]|uniref:Uncharacterized protein n=1 Tax=Sesamum angustifolium TaxID=2727405 RepID=A0AAW2LKD9_9LAMI